MWQDALEVIRYRDMLRSMIASELRTRYKGSFFGFLWTFINPLLTLLVYSMIFATIMRVSIPHYSVFMFIGLLPWNLFATSVQSSTSVVIRQGSLIKKIYFPRQILPLSVVGGGLVNYALSLVVLIPFMIINGFYPSWLWLYLPIIIVVECVLTAGFSLLFSAINVYMRDFEHMLVIFLMLWFYLTPVVYSLSMIPSRFNFLFRLNPMGDVVLSLQQVLFYGEQPHWKMLAYSILFGVAIFMAGWAIFRRLSRRFAEEV